MILRDSYFALFALFIPVHHCLLTNQKFVAHKNCHNHILYQFERNALIEARSNLECAQQCFHDINCISYNYLQDSLECHLNNGVIEENCTNSMLVLPSLYFEKTGYSCLHGGSWNTTTSKCNCVGGYIGSKCERLMKDCSEGESFYAGTYGFYYVFPERAPTPFKILCSLLWGVGRNIIMQHFDPTKTYNRSWAEYKGGFMDDKEENFWLGLDNIYYITQSKRMKIVIETRDPAKNFLKNQYDHFQIGDESMNYKLMSLGNEVNNGMTNCLEVALGSSFSTYDADNDANPVVHCAASYGVGWWFNQNGCTLCNPLGQLNNPPGGIWNGSPSFIHWIGELYSPDFMKIWLEAV